MAASVSFCALNSGLRVFYYKNTIFSSECIPKNEEISYKKHNRRFLPHTYHYGYFGYDVCKKETILEERNRSSRPEMFLRKGVLKIWSKFTGEQPCRNVTSVKLQSNFIEIAL